jgi:hypothetical protein
MRIGQARCVAHEAAGIDKFARSKDGSQRVLLRQRHEFGADPEEKRIARDDERLRMALDKSRKCSVEVTLAAGVRNMHGEAKRARRRLHLACIGLMTPVVGIDQQTEHGGLRDKVMQDADLLLQELLGEEGNSRNVPPGRLMLGTRPNSTGSPPTLNTIGIVAVAAFAAAAAGPPSAAITATRRCTSSAASDGTSPYCSVDRSSIATLRPSIWPSSLNPLRKPVTLCVPKTSFLLIT